jgi:uncharacterized membrane protein YeiH
MTLLALLDFAAVLVFALTGALVASRAQLDIVGFAFMAALPGLGAERCVISCWIAHRFGLCSLSI